MKAKFLNNIIKIVPALSDFILIFLRENKKYFN